MKEIAYKSQVLVAEYMILANFAVASWLEQNSVPGIYRNHLPKQGLGSESLPELFSSNSPPVSHQLGHLLNKASYGRESRGHYALALPHYLHFTSPLRRWADFLVHRCLKAYLKGEPTPYSSEQLEQFAAEINEFHLNQNEIRNEKFRRQAHQKLMKTITNHGYSSLSKAEISRLIKIATKEDKPLDKIKPEIFWRAESGELSNNDYALLLFESNDRELQNLVVESIPPSFLSGFLNNCPRVAKRVQRVEYSDLGTDIRNLVFKNRLFIELDERILTTKSTVDGSNKQQAKINASCAWLEAFLNDNLIEVAELLGGLDDSSQFQEEELPSPDNEAALILDSEELSHELPLQNLNNLCQEELITKPQYNQYQKNGFFVCEVSFLYQGQVYQQKGVALKKKKAQTIAIDKILTAIGI